MYDKPNSAGDAGIGNRSGRSPGGSKPGRILKVRELGRVAGVQSFLLVIIE